MKLFGFEITVRRIRPEPVPEAAKPWDIPPDESKARFDLVKTIAIPVEDDELAGAKPVAGLICSMCGGLRFGSGPV